MVKQTLMMVLAILLAVSAPATLMACTPDDDVESGTVSDTERGTGAVDPVEVELETWNEEEAPRFDYFEATMTDYVTLDPSVYEAMTFFLPADLQVTDDDVEAYIRSALYATGREAVDGENQVTDKPLAWGDDAYVYYRVLVDGKEIAAASYMDVEEPTKLGIGSGYLVPLEEQLVGVIPSQTSRENPAVFEVTFPSSYGISTLAGKTAEAQVYVAYSIRYTMPELTWTYIETTLQYQAQEGFYPGGDAAKIKEFREFVKTYLEAQNESLISTAKQNLIWEKLIDAAAFKTLPQEEVDYYYYQRMQHMQTSYETRQEQYPTLDDFGPVYMGLAVGDDWRAAMREYAERLVKKEILAFAIAKAEGLDTVSEEELQREIDLWIEQNSSNVPVTSAEVKQNVGLPLLYKQAISYKVQTYLLERGTFGYSVE